MSDASKIQAIQPELLVRAQTDDGAAFLVAAQLHLDVHMGVSVVVVSRNEAEPVIYENVAKNEKDSTGAGRRAITGWVAALMAAPAL